MKTNQVIVYSDNNQDFIRLLKHCDLKEKIILYSVKEISKQYVTQFNKENFEINKFKIFFETKFKSFFNVELVFDEGGYIIENNNYYFIFYFIENEIRKDIQVVVKP